MPGASAAPGHARADGKTTPSAASPAALAWRSRPCPRHCPGTAPRRRPSCRPSARRCWSPRCCRDRRSCAPEPFSVRHCARVVARRQRELNGGSTSKPSSLAKCLARRLRRVGIGVVGAHVDVFRLARLALRLPVFRRPLQHRAQAHRNRSDHRRNCTARACALPPAAVRIGERGRIGGGDVGDLGPARRSAVSASVSAVPQPMDRRDLVAGRPFLVLARSRAAPDSRSRWCRRFSLLAADAAVLVDPGEGIGDALAEGQRRRRRWRRNSPPDGRSAIWACALAAPAPIRKASDAVPKGLS